MNNETLLALQNHNNNTNEDLASVDVASTLQKLSNFDFIVSFSFSFPSFTVLTNIYHQFLWLNLDWVNGLHQYSQKYKPDVLVVLEIP